MSFAKMIALFRVIYHADLVDLGNGLNQLHVLSDDKAEGVLQKAYDKGFRSSKILGY